ncbi:hypothetical protein BT67DRAFT_444168 [Trichocladium antarcticum]|uniref:Uncharacterized protein n=1 Tax=Trichocladium antarcticum TaxID=1450529 RepID=A0AAN6UI30_9PEZI|nr:hypothetical protein BT67DRAFT_444168 [Trichocladium antarcticum]
MRKSKVPSKSSQHVKQTNPHPSIPAFLVNPKTTSTTSLGPRKPVPPHAKGTPLYRQSHCQPPTSSIQQSQFRRQHQRQREGGGTQFNMIAKAHVHRLGSPNK